MSDNIKVHCNICNRTTNHKVLSKVEKTIRDHDVYCINYYHICECAGCEDISVMIKRNNSEDFYFDQEIGEYIPEDRYEYYPQRNNGVRNKPIWYSDFYLSVVPNSGLLITAYNKIYENLLNKCQLSTMMFIRTTLDIAVSNLLEKENNIPDQMTGNNGKLCVLFNNGIISETIREDLEKVVFSACSSTIHQGWTPPSNMDVEKIIDILERFLHDAFLSDKNEKHKQKIIISIPQKKSKSKKTKSKSSKAKKSKAKKSKNKKSI